MKGDRQEKKKTKPRVSRINSFGSVSFFWRFFYSLRSSGWKKEGRKMSNESNEDDYQISLEGLANRIVGKSFRTHRHEPGQREAIGKVNVLQAER